ncbi:glycosyl transferases group 1 family protein [Paraburkholderia xenovorans LB400]|uniref:Glycosyltransferase n=1 Tax=Paraburkholderia xenovorans (strain LB400) TaxID=266265 RepID=Q13G46_PARXL|nr:glycosyltransferase WbuB [Paraburkholderia xenovorans]ABE36943.1 Putative glycosyltransferase [Paraburkholderia xenovorans LB400]AIP34872.1 glycosyl transferases group 1 family protein [Paraburkholderia xenovorans LB400]
MKNALIQSGPDTTGRRPSRKVLIYGLNYAPELTGIGKYSAEMAESLADVGYEVRVICAPPYYPEWRIGAGHSAWRYRTEQRAAVRIQRAPVWVPSRPSGLKRLLHLASFAVSSLPTVFAQLFWRPDIVIAVAPSLMNIPAALMFGKMARARTWLHIQDYEVDAAFELGMLKGKRLRQFALGVESWLMRRFDVVSTISARMIEHGRNKGVDSPRLFALPNWVDVNVIFPLDRPSLYRTALNIPDEAIVVLYSGNMGAKQGIEVLAQAAASLAHRSDIHFVLCGDGPYKVNLVEQCGHLANCTFLSLQPFDKLNDLLNVADIHVLPQRADAADLVMPSKLTGMLASGRSIIAMARAGTELFDVVSPRGVTVPPEDVQALVAAIENLADDVDQRTRLGAAARAYAETELSRRAVIERLDGRFQMLCDRVRGRSVFT